MMLERKEAPKIYNTTALPSRLRNKKPVGITWDFLR